MNKNTAQLKSEARGILLGKYGTVIGAMILVELLTLAVSLITSAVTSTNTIYGMIMYYVITFIVVLLTAILGVGLIYLNLNIICERPYKLSDVFYGFKAHPDKAIIVQFLLILIGCACMLPAILVSVLYYFTKNSLLIMLIALLGVLGVIAVTILRLQFSQAFYILLDFPDYSSLDLMRVSKKIMKGHCGRLFYLYISFVPLYLLALLSCGIGFLFITPYVRMTMAYFYMDLIQNNQSHPSQEI